MDLRVTDTLAALAGRTHAAGLVIGTMTMEVDAAPADPDGPPQIIAGDACSVPTGPDIDVHLTAINQFQQLEREAGVRVALAPDAWLQNIGTNTIFWEWAISPVAAWVNGTNVGPHPFLTMHMYRGRDGVLEMIGQSDVKHAFNTVNSGCGCPSGQAMYPGCVDVYGVGSNGDRFFMAPREELTAHSGAWTPHGSHFDAAPTNAVRDHADLHGEHDNFDHRLVVADDALTDTNARYFVEAWYVVAGDKDIFNSMGHREVVPNLNVDTWTFSFADAGLQQGPVVDAWASPTNPVTGSTNAAVTLTNGHLRLAVQTSVASNGLHRYRYALMNLDFDRQVDSLAIPVDPTMTITNEMFYDIDADPTNDWSCVVSNGWVTWRSADNGSARNPLDWGTLFSFGFDASSGPSVSPAVMETAEPGSPSNVLSGTFAPVGAADHDGDGIPTAWEQARGTDPLRDDGGDDDDNDGATNTEEHTADTDPLDPDSVFRVEDLTMQSPVEIFFWSSTARTYTLQYVDDIVSALWSNVPGQTNQTGAGGLDSLTAPEPPSNRYFRIQVDLS